MIDNLRNNNAYTLVEILIAVSLLSLIIISSFSLYKYTTKNFQIGSWRLEEGKRLQHLNSELTRDLSRVPPFISSITETGEVTIKKHTPIFINKLCFSLDPTKPKFINIGNANKWNCLMAFSIATQHIDGSTLFGTEEVKGKWCGIALWAKNGKFNYIRDGKHSIFTSVPTQLPAAIDYPGPDIIGTGLDIEPDNSRNLNRITDTNAEEISIVGYESDNESNSESNNHNVNSLEITIKSIRRERNRTTNTGLSQKVLVKLASGTSVVTF